MGGTFMAETIAESDPHAASDALLARFREWGYTDAEPPEDGGYDGPQSWPDPFTKGFRQVWGKPVDDCAIEWMRGWIAQHPPQGTDPDDKWGPWMAFRLASGGWHFFGWVNT
jgi:hypothetical protein